MSKLIYLNPNCSREISVCTINTHHGSFIHPRRQLNIHVVLYCIYGKMEVYIDGVPYEMNQDDVLILPAETMHYGKKTCPEGTTLCAMHISTDELDSYSEENTKKGNLIGICPLIKCKLKPSIKEAFLNISQTFWGASLLSEIKLSCIIRTLIIDLYNIYQNEISGINVIEKIKKYVCDNIKSDISAEELVTVGGINEKTLRKIFTENTGLTPYSFMKMTKLQYAESLMMAQPEIKIKQLAESIGIDNEFYFSKIFKDFFGDSPSEHKKKILEGQYLSVKSRRSFNEHSFDWTKKYWPEE